MKRDIDFVNAMSLFMFMVLMSIRLLSCNLIIMHLDVFYFFKI